MHFGQLLKALYEARGFTQGSLARASGLSEATVYRGVASDRCPWRRTAAIDVLGALERAAPLTRNERENYLQLAGLEALAKQAEPIARAALDETARVKQAVAGASAASFLDTSPAERRVYAAVDQLIAALGAEELLTVLESAARLAKVELRDTAGGRHAYFHGKVERIEDREVQVHAAHPLTPPRPKAEPKRRTGA